jgi:transposase
MKLHGNAALSLNQRRRLARRVIGEGWSLAEAAKAAEVSERTAGKWVGRYRTEGEQGLLDRPSTPCAIPHRTPEDRVQAIAWLRRLRFTGPEIAEVLEMATSTVSAVLKRIGLGRLSRLEPPEPLRRYEKKREGLQRLGRDLRRRHRRRRHDRPARPHAEIIALKGDSYRLRDKDLEPRPPALDTAAD